MDDFWTANAKVKVDHVVPLWGAAMEVLHRALELPRSHGVDFTNPRSADGVIPDATIRRMMRRAGIAAFPSVVKTIAAFTNTNGGTLLIGIDDLGRPVGIESDFPFVKGRERDGWELALTTAVKTALGPVAATDMSVRFSTLNDRVIARVDVRPSLEPVFASRKGEQREVFFARLNNSTAELSGSALLSYRQKHWPE